MKYLILLALMLPMCKCQETIKFISINGDEEEKKYEIKIIKNEEKKCENIETLNLENMYLHNIKDNIIKCNGIRHINLQKNLLKEIPNLMLRHVPYLYCLNLSNNYINFYNVHTFQHEYLQVLDISNQNIPDEFENMIDIGENGEDTVNIYKFIIFNSTGMFLPNLKSLDLSGNHILSIYDFTYSFPELTHLYLRNIKANALDEQFFHKIPNSLRFLHLENNHFKNLELKNIANITALYLDGNIELEKIDITSTELKILSLSNCRNINTPIFNIPFLEQLDLSKNNFYSLSNIRFENQLLQKLLLNNNNFVEIPLLNIPKLLELSLNYNMIKEILPHRFMNLTSLQKLSLKGNEIERIQKNAFLGLKKLEYLDISENKLKNLPFDWHLSLKSLRHLNVNSNNFTTIFDLPVLYIPSLQHLSVKNNFFKEITTRELNALPNMTTLYLT